MCVLYGTVLGCIYGEHCLYKHSSDVPQSRIRPGKMTREPWRLEPRDPAPRRNARGKSVASCR